jgi:hypothetical protein
MSGSVFGGSKITIQGGPFDDGSVGQTPIKVGYKWWEDINHFCEVLEL